MIQRHKEKRAPTRTHARESPLAPLFICFPLPGPVLYKLGQPGVLFVLPEVLRPSFVLFLRAFPFLCLLATAILDSFSLFYLPNVPPSRDGRPNSLGIGVSRSFWLFPAKLGRRGVLGLSLLLVSSLRIFIAVSI